MEFGIENIKPIPVLQSVCKRRRISIEAADTFLSSRISNDFQNVLPILQASDYYTKPCLSELAIREVTSPGYLCGVRDFIVGRVGYGCIKFLGETDIRYLDLNSIVKFNRYEVIVYEDDSSKPLAGQGLNKPAEVTLLLQLEPLNRFTQHHIQRIVDKLKYKTESQGAKFISLDTSHGEWKFFVDHFSRFGLDGEDEEDILMEDVATEGQDPAKINDDDASDIDEEATLLNPTIFPHSLPAHLGLDPARMKTLKSLFPLEDDDMEGSSGKLAHDDTPSAMESSRCVLLHSSQNSIHKTNSPLIRKTPLALIEYKTGSFSHSPPRAILMTQQNRGLTMTTKRLEGFELDLENKTPVSGSHSCNVVDAALFMGRSFRVGWGRNGILAHSGKPVHCVDSRTVLSSAVNLEKVAIDNAIRVEGNDVERELTDFCFSSPLTLHKEFSHQSQKVELGTFKLKLQKLVCDRLTLPDICRRYIDIIERQLEVPGLSSSSRISLMHQVSVWELIKVLFSSAKIAGQLKLVEDEEDMIADIGETYADVDQEALPLIRRAEFSYWLRESVYHRVQDEVSSLDESSYLEHIFILLTGRQLDASVELAASRGDVRLSCLLSQAGGSTLNRADIGRQLDIWRKNGLDFSFIEDDRMRLLELLAGNIHRSLDGVKIDWKRFLGLLMWYQLPPDISLPVVFNTYQKLLNEGNAPYPVPVYIDEGPRENGSSWNVNGHFDLAYYLMLLHAREENDFGALKTMFSAFASVDDPLDYHMIWHQRAILEAIGTFSSNDLHVLDMAFVSQLICIGQCHWAIYVVLHMPYREDYPYLQITVIREILNQYCDVWSTQDSELEFIENLGIPSAWLHEALAIYSSYIGDHPKALHHFLECENWQRAHSIFLTSVVHSLFLSGKHQEIRSLALSMENYKAEIEDWDLGAGIFISYYSLENSLQEDSYTMTELDTLENKHKECTDFIDRLNESMMVWGSKLSVDGSFNKDYVELWDWFWSILLCRFSSLISALLPFSSKDAIAVGSISYPSETNLSCTLSHLRVVYARMAEEICGKLLACSDESSSHEAKLSCFETAFKARVQEDLAFDHLKQSVSLFTAYVSETAQEV